MVSAKLKLKIWQVSTVVLAILIVIGLFKLNAITGGVVISPQEASDKAINFINDYLLETGEAKLVDVEEESDVYKIKIEILGREYDSYVTKDGKYLFTSGIDLEETPEFPSVTGAASAPLAKVSIDDDPSIGPDDAKVTIVEFSDYQCPFCAKAEPVIKQILETYKDDVKFVYRDFPLSFHQYAQKAAEASECADEQNKFWQYHDKLFENQNVLDTESLKQYAADLNLDVEKFNSCLDSGKYEGEVENDFQDGQDYGVSGTPAFFVNGKLISGAQPFSVFKEIIDEELAK